jgi:hypothetical protein
MGLIKLVENSNLDNFYIRLGAMYERLFQYSRIPKP